jgi:hypothetical protein
MSHLHGLKNRVAAWTDNRRAIEIEKRLGATQTSALYAEFDFGHYDFLSEFFMRRDRTIDAIKARPLFERAVRGEDLSVGE